MNADTPQVAQGECRCVPVDQLVRICRPAAKIVLGSLVFTLPTGDPGGVAVDDPVASAARPHARAASGLTLGQLRRVAAILADSGHPELGSPPGPRTMLDQAQSCGMTSFQELWKSLLPLIPVEQVSLLLAVLAIIISVLSWITSHSNMKAAKRSASAAETQAEAAMTQAESAVKQSHEATTQSIIVREIAEVDSLGAAKARIDQAAPSVVITVPLRDRASRVRVSISDKIPEAETRTRRELNFMESRHYDLYFVLRGTLYNDGNRAVQVVSHGDATFYAGKHPTSGCEVPIPQWSAVEGCHVLYPGQMALFEMHPCKEIDQLMLESEDSADPDLFSTRGLTFRPGNADKPWVLASVKTYAKPLEDRREDRGSIIVKEQCELDVRIDRTLRYPKSFEHLQAKLLNDKDKLQALQWQNAWVEAERRKTLRAYDQA